MRDSLKAWCGVKQAEFKATDMFRFLQPNMSSQVVNKEPADEVRRDDSAQEVSLEFLSAWIPRSSISPFEQYARNESNDASPENYT